MKKSLLALAVLGAFAGVAQAQTAVTIYGSFDGGVRNVTNTNGAGESKMTVGSNGTYNSNRLGFKGVEDLGSGLNAHFNLETGFNTGTGNLESNTATSNGFFWNRTATVGLGGAWGAVDIGHQYSLSFKTIGLFDPFNYKYTGIIPLAATTAVGDGATTNLGGTRLNNDIQYTGAFGPVNVGVEYALGEVAGATRTNGTAAASLSYVNGPFSIGGVYTQKKVAGLQATATTAATANGNSPTFDDKAYAVGAAYKFGAARVSGGYNDEKLSGALSNGTATAAGGDTRQKTAWLGLGYDITPAMGLTAAWYRVKLSTDAKAAAATATSTTVALPGDGKNDLFIVGGTYALSKRTNFYADVDIRKLDGNQVIATTPVGAGYTAGGTQDRQVGFSVGVNHLF